MKQQIAAAVILSLAVCAGALFLATGPAHVEAQLPGQIELACPPGQFPHPYGTTTNTLTEKYRQNICIDSSGTLWFNANIGAVTFQNPFNQANFLQFNNFSGGSIGSLNNNGVLAVNSIQALLNLLGGPFTGGSGFRFKFQDQGVCTMSAGACSAQSLNSTYTAAPVCFVTWTGGGTLTGITKCATTTGSVTPSSSVGTDTAQVWWVAFGN